MLSTPATMDQQQSVIIRWLTNLTPGVYSTGKRMRNQTQREWKLCHTIYMYYFFGVQII